MGKLRRTPVRSLNGPPDNTIKEAAMSTTTDIPVQGIQKRSTSIHKRTRYLYTAGNLLLLVLMFIGFQQFFMHGRAYPDRPLTPPIRNLVIFHGVATTLWMVLALVQPLLISQRKRKLHMKLGMLGAVLAAIVALSGMKVALEWGRVAPPELMLWNLPFKIFMIAPFFIMVVFAGYVTVGIIYRKRPEIHKPALFLGTLFLMPAPIDRIAPILALYQDNLLGLVFGPFVPIFIIGGGFLLVKWLLTHSWDRHFAIAWGIAVVLGTAIIHLARSPASDMVSNLLLRL